MRITTFIGGTSLLLSVWLGFSFIREVPTGSYPLLEKSLTGSTSPATPDLLVATREEAPAER